LYGISSENEYKIQIKLVFKVMKKMMFIAAIAFCAMSCGNKPAEAAAEEAAPAAEEVVIEEAAEAAPADSLAEAPAEEVVEAVAE